MISIELKEPLDIAKYNIIQAALQPLQEKAEYFNVKVIIKPDMTFDIRLPEIVPFDLEDEIESVLMGCLGDEK